MKKTIITISMTVAMAAFLSVGSGGESAATEPTAADEAGAAQTTKVADEHKGDIDESLDPSDEANNDQGSKSPR